MRTQWLKLVATSIIASTCLVGISSAYAQRNVNEDRVKITLRDADLSVATQMLADQSGLQFIIEAGSTAFGKITLSIENQTIEDALKAICTAAKASYRKDENGIFIISNLKETTVTAQQTSADPVEVSKPKIVKKIKLIHVSPMDIYNRFVFDIVDDEGSSVRKIAYIRAVSALAKYAKNNPSLSMNQKTYRPVDSQSTIPSQPRTGTESGNDITIPGSSESANQMGGGGGMRGGGGMGGGGMSGGMGGNQGFGGGNQGFGGGNQGLGGGNQGLGGQNLGGTGIIGQSIDYFSYDPNDNSLVVRGYPEDIETLRSWINTFDIAPQQVIIKVEFITTSNSVTKKLGFDWLYTRGSLFLGNRPGSFADSADPFVISYSTGNLAARMRAMLQEGYGKVVNAPMVRTFNNQFASIDDTITTTRWSPTVTISNGVTYTTWDQEDRDVNTSLYVTPRINGDGTVSVLINTQISDLGQTRVGPDGSESADILTQNINVVARVKDGETIVLGGLNRKSDEQVHKRFPILGDLPVIGQLFRFDRRDVNNSEMLIFVTPTIVSDDSNTGLGA